MGPLVDRKMRRSRGLPCVVNGFEEMLYVLCAVENMDQGTAFKGFIVV